MISAWFLINWILQCYQGQWMTQKWLLWTDWDDFQSDLKGDELNLEVLIFSESSLNKSKRMNWNS